MPAVSKKGNHHRITLPSESERSITAFLWFLPGILIFFPIVAFVALYFHLHLSNIEKTSLIIIKFHGFQDPPSALLEVTMLTTKLKS